MKHEWLQHLSERPPVWSEQPETGAALVALSSRIRLARNVAGYSFPGRIDAARKDELFRCLDRVLSRVFGEGRCAAVRMPDLDAVGRDILFERRLISRQLVACGPGSGLVVADGGSVSAMINEEDHIRLQVVQPGIALRGAWKRASALDDGLAESLRFSFDRELGFLTACPSNVGTGLRASVMLHLPALRLRGQMEGIGNALARLGFALRGAYGEGSEATGNLFQLSNQSTLGESEDEIISRLREIILQVVEHEQHARRHLLVRETRLLSDRVGRAYGHLRHARLLPSGEALDCWSMLWLGVEVGLFSHIDRETVIHLFMPLQPGHLQFRLGTALSPGERDGARADMIRQALSLRETRSAS